jgi:hypothetical protein
MGEAEGGNSGKPAYHIELRPDSRPDLDDYSGGKAKLAGQPPSLALGVFLAA